MKIVLLFSLFLLSIGCFVMCGLCGSIRRSMGRLPPDDATYIMLFLVMPVVIPVSEIGMAWYKFSIKYLGRDPHIRLSDCEEVKW